MTAINIAICFILIVFLEMAFLILFNTLNVLSFILILIKTFILAYL